MEVDVKIKRYMAASMRAALSQVRAEQGPDAVILSSRRVDEGIEVIAAVDYDEALFVDATRPQKPAQTASQAHAPVQPQPAPPPQMQIHAPAPSRASAPARRVPGAAPSLAAGGGFVTMQREFKELRELLETELAHMSWHDKRLREPLQTRVLEELSAMD